MRIILDDRRALPEDSIYNCVRTYEECTFGNRKPLIAQKLKIRSVDASIDNSKKEYPCAGILFLVA